MSSPPPAKRLACDQCHSKKIRCIIEKDHQSCARCEKQGISERCIFSPPAKTGRPAHQKMRRSHTAPSPKNIRHRTSPSFSSVPSQTVSLSPSPAPFPQLLPQTPSIDTNVPPATMFYNPDFSYPLFGEPVVVESNSYGPGTTDSADFFQEYMPAMLTPSSVDQGYGGSCSSVTTIPSLDHPFMAQFGDEQHQDPVTFQTSPVPQFGDEQHQETFQTSPVPQFGGEQHQEPTTYRSHTPSPELVTHTQVLEANGLNLAETHQQLSELSDTFLRCASRSTSSDDHRVEGLLRATERVNSLLEPFFTLSPHSPNVASSLNIATLSFMIDTVIQAAEAYSNVINPASTVAQARPVPQMSQQGSPPPQVVSPQALGIQSVPVQSPPPLQPSNFGSFSAPLMQGTTNSSISTPRLKPSTMGHSRKSSVPAIAPAMSPDTLPITGPTILGQYLSNHAELSRWVLVNVMLFQLRSLSRLRKRMEVCLAFCAPATVAQNLEKLKARLNSIKTQVRKLVEMFDDEDH